MAATPSCNALTRKGLRCKRTARVGLMYCTQHAKLEAERKTDEWPTPAEAAQRAPTPSPLDPPPPAFLLEVHTPVRASRSPRTVPRPGSAGSNDAGSPTPLSPVPFQPSAILRRQPPQMPPANAPLPARSKPVLPPRVVAPQPVCRVFSELVPVGPEDPNPHVLSVATSLVLRKGRPSILAIGAHLVGQESIRSGARFLGVVHMDWNELTEADREIWKDQRELWDRFQRNAVPLRSCLLAFHTWCNSVWYHFPHVRIVCESPLESLGCLNECLLSQHLCPVNVDRAHEVIRRVESVTDIYTAVTLTLGREPEPVPGTDPDWKVRPGDAFAGSLHAALRFIAAVGGRSP